MAWEFRGNSFRRKGLSSETRPPQKKVRGRVGLIPQKQKIRFVSPFFLPRLFFAAMYRMDSFVATAPASVPNTLP